MDWRTYAQSAGLTFATALGLELYAAMATADDWSGVGWNAVVSGATFAAVRTLLRWALDGAVKR